MKHQILIQEIEKILSSFAGGYLIYESMYRRGKIPATAQATRNQVMESGINELLSLFAQERQSLIKEVEEKLKKLMPEKRVKQFGDNLELYGGERSCKLCGINPEKQREMVLSQLSQLGEDRE